MTPSKVFWTFLFSLSFSLLVQTLAINPPEFLPFFSETLGNLALCSQNFGGCEPMSKRITRRVDKDGFLRIQGKTYKVEWMVEKPSLPLRFRVLKNRDGEIFLAALDSKPLSPPFVGRLFEAEPMTRRPSQFVNVDRMNAERPTPEFLQGLGQMVCDILRVSPAAYVKVAKEINYAEVPDE